MSDPHKPWEPDPAKLGNWQSMFDQQRGNGPPSHPPPDEPAEAFDDADLYHIDPAEYRPWILQRGRTRGAMMLALRWFDAKAGLWHGSAMAYPSLYAIDSIGASLISLDFGLRQYVVEGDGLDTLARHIQQGSVLGIVQHSAALWPSREQGAVVTMIKRVECVV